MWPYCLQPLYHTAMPVMLNVTLLNSISLVSSVVSGPTFTPSAGAPADLLQLSFAFSQPLWPWSGWLAMRLTVSRDVSERVEVDGVVELQVESDDGSLSPLSIPLRVAVIPRPPRSRRVLWDQFHNLRYPSGYFPRDNLEVKTDTLDWNGDHPHTNYRELFSQLSQRGFHLEILGHCLLCFDARLYQTLIIADPEEVRAAPCSRRGMQGPRLQTLSAALPVCFAAVSGVLPC
jgi:membrane-bound transcription factor site-1 protease